MNGPESRTVPQGTIGHDGWHWSYRPDGWLARWPSKKAIRGKWDIAYSVTPPGHKHYIEPKKMTRHAYVAVYVRTHKKQMRAQQERFARRDARRSKRTARRAA